MTGTLANSGTRTVAIDEWLAAMDREYLSTFIKDGGAAVKFAVADEERKRILREELKSRCAELNYVFVTLDAISRRVHMPQDIFFALASQLDWRILARRAILRLLGESRYNVEGIDTGNIGNVADAVAVANDVSAEFMLAELRPKLEKDVFKNPDMARAFRVAMTHLCRLEWQSSTHGDYAGQPLLDWLSGANTRIGNLRPFQIHTPINRTTARYFIESALYWIRRAGYSGTVILLDNSRVTMPRNPRDGQRYYTRAMTIDHYELLRQFIDDVDRLSGLLLTVVTDQAFVADDSARGWNIYAALRTRVMDDVRDRNIGNPVAALVRLA